MMGALTSDTISERVSKAYREHLFGDATLQDLPDHPRFVINATSVQSGALFRFSKPYMADWRVGRVNQPTVALADAVAASSAFPPVLSPFELDLRDATWVDEPGNDLGARRVPRARGARATAASTTTSASRPPGRRATRSSSRTPAAR